MGVINDELRARVRELHGRGLGRNAIATDLGVARGTVSKVAAELGLDFDRAATAVALEARKVDQKARRTDIIDRLYKRSEFILARLERPHFDTLVPTGPGVSEPKSLPFVPAPDERQLAAAMSSHLANAAKLEAIDADTGTGEVQSVVDDLRAAFKVISDTKTTTEGNADE